VDFQLNLDTETVDECHSHGSLCLAPTDTVAEAMRQMKERNRGAVLVCHNQMVVGIFTERDALAMMAAAMTSGAANFEIPLERVMTPNPTVLRAGDAVAKAITLMAKGGYRRLPIVDDRGQPTGFVKAESIMHYLVEHFPKVIHTLPPKPHSATQAREGA
jgi:CBS domain-containing protein